VPEARKDINEILRAQELVLQEKVKIPDFALGGGEVLWMEMENPNWAKLLLPFFSGLLYHCSGTLTVAGKDFNRIEHKENLFSCIHISSYQAGPVLLNSLVHWIARRQGCNAAGAWSNCKRILSAIGCEYVCQVFLEKIAANTMKKINTAVTLSIPKLVIVLNDPFFGLEENEKVYISNEIDNLAKDGSSILIMSQDTPYCRFDKNIFLETIA
jgi:ABC-type multidrug transport system ATPase subunit